jgi:hypothetical protein
MMPITKRMIYKWNMDEKTGDWLGYVLEDNDEYSFHHLIIPKAENGPKEFWNGAILCKKTGHTYLHIIETKDKDLFLYLTKLLILINLDGKLPDNQKLRIINNALESFEREYEGKVNRSGDPIIREEYTKRLVRKNICITHW